MEKVGLLILLVLFFMIFFFESTGFGSLFFFFIMLLILKGKFFSVKTKVHTVKFEGFVNIERRIKNNYPEIDFEILKEELLIIYKNVYSKLNENSTKDLNFLVTDDLFSDYTNDVTVNMLKKEIEIVKDMSFSDCYVCNFEMINNDYLISLVVDVTAFYYSFDEINNKVVAGSDVNKETRRFKLTFVSYDNKKEVCYNCFRDAKINELGACSYCGVNMSGFGGLWQLSDEKQIFSNEVFYEKEN